MSSWRTIIGLTEAEADTRTVFCCSILCLVYPKVLSCGHPTVQGVNPENQVIGFAYRLSFEYYRMIPLKFKACTDIEKYGDLSVSWITHSGSQPIWRG